MACRTQPSTCDTLSRFCARHVRCWSAFLPFPTLRSTCSVTGCPALFAGFVAAMAESDFSGSCIIGYDSEPRIRADDTWLALGAAGVPPSGGRAARVLDGSRWLDGRSEQGAKKRNLASNGRPAGGRQLGLIQTVALAPQALKELAGTLFVGGRFRPKVRSQRAPDRRPATRIGQLMPFRHSL